MSVVYPAEQLCSADTAQWVRRHGVTVAAHSSNGLALALSVGIRPGHLVAFGDRGQWGPIRCAMNAGVRQFVVEAYEQISVLEHCARRRQQVLVDVGMAGLDDAVAQIHGSDRLELVGLHSRLDGGSRAPHAYAGAVGAAFAQMAQVRNQRRTLISRISLSGPTMGVPRVVAAVVQDAVEDGCARWHLPRPGLTFAPRPG